MKMIRYVRGVAASVLGFAPLILPVAAEQPTKIDFSNETVGAEPKALVPVVGIWRIESEGGKNVLAVDGRQWKEGQSSAGVADKARALYGERYAEFLDRVQAYAYYPYAVTKTGPGHASLATGTSPDRHGIISNDWYDRDNDETVYCVGSARYEQVPPRAAKPKDDKDAKDTKKMAEGRSAST